MKLTKPLTGKEKIYLRGLGHSLRPLMQIGKFGITEAFLTKAREILLQHELVKIRVMKGSPLPAAEAAEELAQRIPCHVAQIIGKTLLIYVPHPEDPQIRLPR